MQATHNQAVVKRAAQAKNLIKDIIQADATSGHNPCTNTTKLTNVLAALGDQLVTDETAKSVVQFARAYTQANRETKIILLQSKRLKLPIEKLGPPDSFARHA